MKSYIYIRTCSSACHSLLRMARGFNILFQIMVTFYLILSYISNACHSLPGVAERLQHTYVRTLYYIVCLSEWHVAPSIYVRCILGGIYVGDALPIFASSHPLTGRTGRYISDACAFS